MPDTMSLISSQTLGSSAAKVTFSSIPQTFTDLVIKISARNSGTGATYNEIFISFNGNPTGTLHTNKALYTIGTTVGSNGATGTDSVVAASLPLSDSTADIFSNAEIYVPSYANSSYTKPFFSDTVTENNTTGNGYVFNALIAGLYASTSPITSIVLNSAGASSFLTNSKFSLYGIKNS